MAVVLLIARPAFGLSYSATAIEGVVVDAQTRAPLEGVIVVVQWTLEDSEGRGGRKWKVDETVTDREGRYRFAKWGPEEVPGKGLRLGSEQPALYYFKSNYAFGVEHNPWESWMLGKSEWTGDLTRSSIWDKRTVALRLYQGNREQYLRSLDAKAGQLPFEECRWSKIPRLTAALVNERGTGRSTTLPALPTMLRLEKDAANSVRCPNPHTHLEPYLK